MANADKLAIFGKCQEPGCEEAVGVTFSRGVKAQVFGAIEYTLEKERWSLCLTHAQQWCELKGIKLDLRSVR